MSLNKYIQPGVVSKDRFAIMVSEVVKGSQLTDERLFDHEVIKFTAAWLARAH